MRARRRSAASVSLASNVRSRERVVCANADEPIAMHAAAIDSRRKIARTSPPNRFSASWTRGILARAAYNPHTDARPQIRPGARLPRAAAGVSLLVAAAVRLGDRARATAAGRRRAGDLRAGGVLRSALRACPSPRERGEGGAEGA